MKTYLISTILSASLAFGSPFTIPLANMQGDPDTEPPDMATQLAFIDGTSLLSRNIPVQKEPSFTSMLVTTTAYSSTPDQTDDTPFTTASGTQVREGVVAANFLPIGTIIRMPDLYGDRVFTVEDRMHPRKGYQVDIWFPSKTEALRFGT
ncbi:MAG: hypothetical protein Q7R48_02135, partial [bacterium]|nr:hypothetical protein [bacterium]